MAVMLINKLEEFRPSTFVVLSGVKKTEIAIRRVVIIIPQKSLVSPRTGNVLSEKRVV